MSTPFRSTPLILSLLSLQLLPAAEVPTQPAAPPQLATPIRLTPSEFKKHTAPQHKAAADGPVSGFVVDTADRTAVLALYHHAYTPSENYRATHGWTGNVANCIPGTISNDLVEDTRRRVNYFRAMAGLNADITFDPSKAAKCQQAALLMSHRRGLSHTPNIHWPTEPCLTADANEAAGASNLSLGNYGPAAIEGQLIDDGSNNAATGHRRWILYSRAREMATGDIPGDSTYLAANSLWVTGDFGPALAPARAVAWPPAGHVPYHLAPSERQDFPRWSYGYPGANFTNANVTMNKGGTDVPVTEEPPATGAGDSALVWRPSGIPSTPPESDTTYTVNITGITGPGPASVSYDVTLIDPYDLGVDVTLTGTPSPTTGQTNIYTPTAVSNATAYRTLAATYTAGAWLEGAEDPPAPRVIDGTDASYSLREAATRPTGTYSFHLAIPDFGARHHFVIDRDLVPLAGSAVHFKYRRLFIHPDSSLRVQLSTDDGQSFTTIGSIPGNNTTGNSAEFDPLFVATSFPVPDRFHSRHTKIRFMLEDDGTTFTGSTTNHGIYIDDVTMTNHHELTGGTPVTVNPVNPSLTHTPSSVDESRLLMAGVELGGRFWGYGPVLQVQSVTAPAGPSPTFAAYAAANNISDVPGTDHDGDGFPSLLEWALGLSDPSDPSSVPTIIPGTEGSGSSTYLTASYLRFTGGNESANTYTHAPLTYTANATDTLTAWPLAPTHTTTAPNLPTPPAGFAWATLRFPTTTSTTPQGAIRITIATQ